MRSIWYNKNDSLISFIMNEKESIVYFYCGKKKAKKNIAKKNCLAYGKRIGLKFILKLKQQRENKKLEKQRRAIWESWKPAFHEKRVYGISILSCECPDEMLSVSEETVSRLQKIGLDRREESNTVFVCYDEQIRKHAGITTQCYPLLLLRNYYKKIVRNGILIIRDGVQADSFLKAVYENLNRLLIITDQRESWNEFAEYVYEDSGLVVEFQIERTEKEWEETGEKIWQGQYLFDFNEVPMENVRAIPKKTYYVDLIDTSEMRRVIEAKRKDVHYIGCSYDLFGICHR